MRTLQFLGIITVFQIFIICSCDYKETIADKTTKSSAESTDSKQLPRVEVYTPEGEKLISKNQKVDTLAGGFVWTEGPLFIKNGGYLLFSDIPQNKIFKLTDNGSVQEYLSPSGYTGTVERGGEPGSNGLLLSPQNQLVLCQHGDGRMAVMDAPIDTPRPIFKILADKYQGKKLNSPNDAVYHSNGDLYFTDPPYGLEGLLDDPAKELDFQGVYRLRPDGQLDLLTADIKYPNGILLSPDESTLYVANSDHEAPDWWAFDIDDNGLLENGRIFYDAHSYGNKNVGNPDGMELHKEGYIFATGPEGVWIFDDQANIHARIFTGQLTSNLTFSTNQKYLFMTCDDFIMGIRLK